MWLLKASELKRSVFAIQLFLDLAPAISSVFDCFFDRLFAYVLLLGLVTNFVILAACNASAILGCVRHILRR
ncbi:hypothetical protein ASE94_19520 [Devosia sp. Leaf64]|nr:hypothetical protein ASE94_19520 [Devosia sp. Leaf64]